MSKSESDQEDNDDLNDNDWSYGAEKKCESLCRTSALQRCPGCFHMLNFLCAPPQPRRESPIRYLSFFSVNFLYFFVCNEVIIV